MQKCNANSIHPTNQPSPTNPTINIVSRKCAYLAYTTIAAQRSVVMLVVGGGEITAQDKSKKHPLFQSPYSP